MLRLDTGVLFCVVVLVSICVDATASTGDFPSGGVDVSTSTDGLEPNVDA